MLASQKCESFISRFNLQLGWLYQLSRFGIEKSSDGPLENKRKKDGQSFNMQKSVQWTFIPIRVCPVRHVPCRNLHREHEQPLGMRSRAALNEIIGAHCASAYLAESMRIASQYVMRTVLLYEEQVWMEAHHQTGIHAEDIDFCSRFGYTLTPRTRPQVLLFSLQTVCGDAS